MNVFVVVYTKQGPIIGNNQYQSDPVDWSTKYSKCMMQELTRGTIYHGYSQPTAQPYLVWQPYANEGVHAINSEPPDYCEPDNSPCAGPEKYTADITQIFNDIDDHFFQGQRGAFCSKINDGSIQELWLWSDGFGNFAEHLATGPLFSEGGLDGFRMRNACGSTGFEKQFVVMGLNFSPNTSYSNALHSYNHRLDYAFDQLFPCEFDISSDDPWTDLPGLPKTNHDIAFRHDCGSRHAFTARAYDSSSSDLTQALSQCGQTHWPPNVDEKEQSTTLEYMGYQNTGLQLSTACDSWDPNPYHLEQPIFTGNCATTLPDGGAWGCTGTKENSAGQDGDAVRFYVWTMQNMPGEGNTVKRCDGSAIGNWWDYLRGDLPKPATQDCHPGGSVAPSISGLAQAGPLTGALIRLYTLEPGGVLLPVPFAEEIRTTLDGTYHTPSLPNELDGKTLVIEASGGKFVDEASGKTFSFVGHSMYSVIPVAHLGYPLGGVVTPFTDMAFRQTQHDLSADPSLVPSDQASLNNFWIAREFNLGDNEGSPIQPEMVRPANLFDGKAQSPDEADPYALALAGLSQQALDAGLSPVDWITQLSADAEDGALDGAARNSAQSISNAETEFIDGPRSPFPPTATPTPIPTETPMATPTMTPTAGPLTQSFTSIGAQDGWILESSETSNTGGTVNKVGTVIRLGDDGSNRQFKAILSFNTSPLPDRAAIISAVLKVKQSGKPVGVNPFHVLGKLWVDIRQGVLGGGANLQRSDFSAPASAAQVGAFNKIPAGGWYSVALNTIGLGQINTTTLNGGVTQFRLYFAKDDNNNYAENFVKFFSGNSSANRPILVITYAMP